MNDNIIIPARLESRRLPDKPLLEVAGKPLVQRVWERARESGAARVCVATDSPRIRACAEAFGAEVVMTRADHESGTSRLAEAVDALGLPDDAVVVNLQGDEPLMPPACLDQVAALIREDPDAHMATLWRPLQDEREWRDPNTVKVICAHDGRALYFSRAPIPWPREAFAGARAHLGLYAYRCGALRAWSSLPSSDLEAAEKLEQLRALQAGWVIRAAEAIEPVPGGVDTVEDLERVEKLIAQSSK